MGPIVNGPLRVSPNGRYFVDGKDQPFFWLGDTAWPLFGQYSLQEAEEWLERRARQGFTVIQGVLGWGGGTGFETKLPGPNHFGHQPWLGGPEHPNEAYFKHVDYLLTAAEKLGLVLAMLPTWGYYVVEAQTFNVDNARIYGRWLGERYRARPNVVWVNGGDRIPTGKEEVFRALADGLRQGDGGTHLITYHPCGWRHSSQFFHGEEWLDFNMIETWTEWVHVYEAVRADYGLVPVKPVVLGEPAYEDGPEYPLGPISPLIVRRQAWWSWMGGGFFTYGNNQNWRMEPGFLSYLSSPGAEQMGIFRKITGWREWWKMVPDQSIFADGVSCERTLNTAVRAEDSSWAMIYLSSQCHVQLYLERILTKSVKITWVNPQTGEEKDGGVYPTGNCTGKAFPDGFIRTPFTVPAYWEDAVIILDGME
jgi:hypothetical protein